ncbi:MAG: DNA helicase II / ATP-dependent DNA helicase PcrA [Parcubacteria group bacterium Gr01-1014_20]|nr:MAG: DNA helicase II / ATP-dependent DNA helicase PcrA [Parcubacteria group bacterium Gr01-1014_20]
MITEANFAKTLANLNPKQREAVETIDGPVMVIAGPGTGKTQILTLRIANILAKSDTPADSILALTFTESAAANMRRRLVNLIGSRGYYVTIGTFHSFCNTLIQEYPENYEELIGGKNTTEVSRISIIREILDLEPYDHIKPFGDKYFYVRDILASIKNLKNEGISAKAFIEIAKEEAASLEKRADKYHLTGAHAGKIKGEYQKQLKDSQKNSELGRVYKKYQEILRDKRFYDFEDMILETIKAFETKAEFLREVQEKFQYLLIDEHQDTNGAQNRILELICDFYPNPNLFVVGDEKQAIFRFQGANLDNFLYFQKKYPSVKLINLEDSYRSTQTILDSAQDLIEKNRTTIFSPLRATTKDVGEKIKVYAFETPEGEGMFIVEEIKLLLDNEIKPEQIAILYRENRDAKLIADFLNKAGLAYVIESESNILDDPDIKKLNLIFSAINEFGNDEKLLEVLHIDFLNIDPLDIYQLSVATIREKRSLHKILDDPVILRNLEISNSVQLSKIYQLFKKWSKKSRNDDFIKFFEAVLNESGFLSHIIQHGEYLQKIDKLSSLFREIRKATDDHRAYSLREYLEHLDILKTHGLSLQSKSATTRNAVRLMTAHRAKGLEFSTVFLTKAVDGHWGNKRHFDKFKIPFKTSVNIDETEKNEDERRLFYMCLTRAKRHVFITYSTKNEEGRDQIPSQFLGEIRAELKTEILGGDFDRKFLENRAVLFDTSKVKNVTSDNQELFIQIFEKRGLSVSALNNYLACPWKYFYLNLLRIPRSKNKSQMFGTAVHFALKNFFDAKRGGKLVDAPSILLSFENALSREPLTKTDFEETLSYGKKILEKYYNFYQNSWNYNTVNEFAIKGVMLENIKLTGKLDKIEITENPKHVIVVDYKTKEPGSRNQILGLTKNSTGDYKRQLVFYKLLLELKPEKTWEMDAGVIDFIEPNPRGTFKREFFEIQKSEVDELKEIIQKAVYSIRNLEFWNTRCNKKDCKYCGLRDLMR